jgi:hypothetical protein|uniref:Uncharacterized protein n=1 Tax=viral metagenome TaxID=1070528 RepID=A0A6C0HF22_9ZZZZ
MHEWCDTVVEMSDCEPHNAKHIKKICHHVFRYMCTHKFKDDRKFRDRRGVEYDVFLESLASYPPDIVHGILDYPGFLEKTHQVAHKHKSKTNRSKD